MGEYRQIQYISQRRGRGAVWESSGCYISVILLDKGELRGRRISNGWGRQCEMVRACTPHPQQAGPKIPSSLNVRKTVVISSLLYSLQSVGQSLYMKRSVIYRSSYVRKNLSFPPSPNPSPSLSQLLAADTHTQSPDYHNSVSIFDNQPRSPHLLFEYLDQVAEPVGGPKSWI